MNKEETVRISEGHGDYAPEEMLRIYQDIRNTGKELKVPTPLLDSYEKFFIEMQENIPH